MLRPPTPIDEPAARRRLSNLLAPTSIVLTFALTLSAFAPAALASPASAGWYKQSSGTTASLEMSPSPTPSHGWAVGGYGTSSTCTILATTDGGATWSASGARGPDGLWPRSPSRHHPRLGRGPRYGTILATRRRRRHLGRAGLRVSDEWLYGVAFIDATHGWAVGDDGSHPRHHGRRRHLGQRLGLRGEPRG